MEDFFFSFLLLQLDHHQSKIHRLSRNQDEVLLYNYHFWNVLVIWEFLQNDFVNTLQLHDHHDHQILQKSLDSLQILSSKYVHLPN